METGVRPDAGQLLDAMVDGVYGIDRAGLCTFANKAALTLLRCDSEADLVGRNMHDAIHHTHPDGSTYPARDCPRLRTLRTGVSVTLDEELLWRRDGTSFYAEYSSHPVTVDGSVVGSVITFGELSLRRDGRRRLALHHEVSQILGGEAETAEAQSRVLAAIGSGFGWDAGAMWLSDEMRDGDPVWQCVAAWQGPETSRHVREIGERAHPLVQETSRGSSVVVGDWHGAEGGASRVLSRASVAFPLRTDNQTLGVLQFVSRTSINLDRGSDEVLATLGRQVGQFLKRRATDAALRDSEALKTAVMQTALDCVVVVDEETRIIEFNPAAEKTFGQSRESALGQELGALILPADFLVGHLKKFAHFLEEGETSALGKHVEVEAERANGERFPAELAVTPIKVGGRALFTAYLRDITERKRAEHDVAAARDDAQEANKAKSQFLANMSHELRTPLSAIIDYSEMLQEEMEDGADAAGLAPDMHKIENNARHLLGLINDVLDISKIESGKMEVFPEDFDVGSMVRDVASTVSALVEKKGNALKLDFGPDLGCMRSDLTKIKQMLLNLLSNGAKFTEGGTISLSVTRGPGEAGAERLTFEVQDEGIGMTEDQLGRLFQRFSQAEASTSSKFGGTGLGLSISKAFASMLGGTIEVASTYGKGSSFTIVMPASLPG